MESGNTPVSMLINGRRDLGLGASACYAPPSILVIHCSRIVIHSSYNVIHCRIYCHTLSWHFKQCQHIYALAHILAISYHMLSYVSYDGRIFFDIFLNHICCNTIIGSCTVYSVHVHPFHMCGVPSNVWIWYLCCGSDRVDGCGINTAHYPVFGRWNPWLGLIYWSDGKSSLIRPRNILVYQHLTDQYITGSA